MPTKKIPAVGNIVKLRFTSNAGCRAEVIDRRKNGIYRVRLLEGPEQGAEKYGLCFWEMEICHDRPAT